MTRSYKKLWHILLDRDISRTQLREMAGITTNALAKLGKDESLPLATLEKVCAALNCTLDDILDSDCGESGGWSGGQEDTVKDNDLHDVSHEDTLEEIIEKAIQSNAHVTRTQIAKRAGVSEKTIARKLKEMPHILYVGSGNNGHWEISDSRE